VTRIGELAAIAVTSNQHTQHALVPSSPVLVTLMMEALRSSAPSVLTGIAWRVIPEDAILRSHLRENLKSYLVYFHLIPFSPYYE
jgi:hypothetical protein